MHISVRTTEAKSRPAEVGGTDPERDMQDPSFQKTMMGCRREAPTTIQITLPLPRINASGYIGYLLPEKYLGKGGIRNPLVPTNYSGKI